MADANDRPVLLRQRQVRLETGYARSTIYARVQQGLLPPPVKLGPRSVAWPAAEIAAVNAARIAARSDSEIREIVSVLLSRRSAL